MAPHVYTHFRPLLASHWLKQVLFGAWHQRMGLSLLAVGCHHKVTWQGTEIPGERRNWGHVCKQQSTPPSFTSLWPANALTPSCDPHTSHPVVRLKDQDGLTSVRSRCGSCRPKTFEVKRQAVCPHTPNVQWGHSSWIIVILLLLEGGRAGGKRPSLGHRFLKSL